MMSYNAPKQKTISPDGKIPFEKHGIIVIGYPGIGKTSVVKTSVYTKIIDFESSNFYIGEERIPKWYKIYCKQAVALAKQGYMILVSSHKEVRDELGTYIPDNDFDVITITPSFYLKDEWAKKLYDRYSIDPTRKNEAAWKNANQHYCQEICEIAGDIRFSHIFINSMDYSLGAILSDIGSLFNFGRRR